jgi:sugar phosphate isomerase/epimerase
MQPGLNLEFARSGRLDWEGAFRAAHDAGYEFIEPYVYSRVSLALNSHLRLSSASSYHHLEAGSSDVVRIGRLCGELGLRFSAFDAHASLLLPQVGIPYLQSALDLAADLHCPLVVSDEGPVPAEWMTLNQGLDIVCASLKPIIRHAQKRGVKFALELHNALTAQPDCLRRLLQRFGPDELGVNFDTGNSFLAGNDPVAYAASVADRVVHVHIKDIPASQLPERGSVTGTRVGVAVGEGVVDLGGVIAVLARTDYAGVLSVECDTAAQARASLSALNRLIHAAAGESAT